MAHIAIPLAPLMTILNHKNSMEVHLYYNVDGNYDAGLLLFSVSDFKARCRHPMLHRRNGSSCARHGINAVRRNQISKMVKKCYALFVVETGLNGSMSITSLLSALYVHVAVLRLMILITCISTQYGVVFATSN